MKRIFSIFSIFVFLFLSHQLYAQDLPWPDLGAPMIIEPGHSGKINEVINGDTTVTGERKHHHYILRRGETYVYTEPIRTKGWPLKITAGTGTGSLPIIKALGPKPGDYELDGILHVEGDLYLKGVTINGYDQFGNFVNGPHIRIAADGITAVCENVNFDFSQSKSISIHNQNCSLFVEDCVFGNQGIPSRRHRNELLLIRKANSSVIHFKNNIIYNVEHLICRNFGSAHTYKKLVFEHNTIVNTGSGGYVFGAPDTLIYRNNLHVNIGILSDYYNSIDDQPFRPVPYYFSIDSMESFVPNHFEFTHNHYYLNPTISSFLPDSSTISTEKLFSDYLWNLIKDEPGNLIKNEEFQFSCFPASDAEYELYVSDFYDQKENPVTLPQFNTDFTILDFSYPSSHPAYTAGSEGQPLGKLDSSYTIEEPFVYSPIYYCVNDPAQPLFANGENLTWYTEKGGASSTVAPTPETSQVDTLVFYVTYTENDIESEPDSITAIINPKPEPPAVTDTILELTNSPLFIKASGSNLIWYENESLTDVYSDEDSISLNDVGKYTFFVTQSVLGCESDTAGMNIMLNPVPPVVQDTLTKCYWEEIDVIVTGKNITWYHDENSMLYDEPTFLPRSHKIDVTEVTSEVPFSLPLGNHKLLVTQTINNIESKPDTLIIQVLPNPDAPVANDTTFSFGDEPVLYAQGNKLFWYPDTFFYEVLSTDNYFHPNISHIGKYDYFVKQSENGCGSSATKVYLTIIPAPPIANDLYFCEGNGMAQLSAEGENIKWYTDENLISPVYEGNQFTTAKKLPGTYTYYVTQTISGLQSLANKVTLKIKPLPEVSKISDQYACDGDIITLNIGHGFDSYKWNTGSTASSIDVASSGTYSVTVTKNGCSNSSSTNVTIHDVPQISLNGQYDVCEGESATLNAGHGFNSYKWNTGSTASSIDVTSSGTYSVTVTNDECSNSSSTNVTIHDVPQISLNGPYTICNGEHQTLNAGSGFSSYQWNTGEISSSIDVEAAGTYAVTVTNENCSSSSYAEVYVNSLPAIDLEDSYEACAGNKLTLDAGTGMDNYSWSTGASSQSIQVMTSGKYSVSVSKNNCENSASTQVTFNDIPEIDLGGPFEACQGETITLDAGTFDSYHWSTGKLTKSIDVDASGTYAVTVTSANCTNTSSADVTFHDSPIADIGGPYEACVGESVTLDAGPGYDAYQWNTDETSQSINVSETGTYSVKVTQGLCSNTISTEVTMHSIPAVALDKAYEICDGEPVTLDAGSGFDSYQWSTGETSQSISVSKNGAYAVNVTKGICTESSVTNVSVNKSPDVELGGPFEINENDTLVLDAGSGFNNYSWNDGSTNQRLIKQNPLPGYHEYMVTVTNDDGCSNSDTAQVTVSVVNSIVSKHAIDNLSIYPNPSNGFIFIKCNDETAEFIQVTIRDVSGRALKVIKNYHPSNLIDLTEFDSGLYLITLTFDNNTQISNQFVIN